MSAETSMKRQRNGGLLMAWVFLLVAVATDTFWVRAVFGAGALSAAFYAGMVHQFMDDDDDERETA